MKGLAKVWGTQHIGKKVGATVMILFTVALALTIGVVYNLYRAEYKASVQKNIASVGKTNAANFADWIDARKNEIEFVATLDAIVEKNEPGIKELFTKL